MHSWAAEIVGFEYLMNRVDRSLYGSDYGSNWSTIRRNLRSALWKIAGENTLPSKNDQIATNFSGSFLGESLYRMANLVLEQGSGPRFWRELSAAIQAHRRIGRQFSS